MATVNFKGNLVDLIGDFPKVGEQAPDFKLIRNDLMEIYLSDFKGKKIVLNIFPSVDTAVCALQLKTFNAQADSIEDAVLIFASLDSPFAFGRFCAAEGIEDSITVSDFRYKSLSNYGVEMKDGPLAGLYARAVFIINEDQKITYSQLVPEITEEPDYEAALAALK